MPEENKTSIVFPEFATAVYGAIALSLVAAIAAIVAVITLQRKVAG